MPTQLSEKETYLVIEALNEYWYNAHLKLNDQHLGDIQKKNLEEITVRAKELMNKLNNQ